MRRYGNPPISGQDYTLRPGAYAILPRDGKLLMTFQAAPEPEFQLPGGGIDAGESPLQALHREVWEETGWSIAAPRRIGVYRRFVWMPDYEMFAEKLCHVFLARPVMKRSEPMEPDHTALWLAPELAVDLIASEGDRDVLAALI
ncbi:NUDIX hydrolase [Pseudooceanicola sp. HF7]|uniref:NUDIX hydrolase n=1 Tax=Pseudooceanicola sp. HF7 TaxID=2721560 RepID=UPI001431382A|nr:NUDIX hydrolase [Pseudooceanicola sp. HF7]NIZ09647.1 NUDIX hydrolase [Pseudooceanicola sp. HF7]